MSLNLSHVLHPMRLPLELWLITMEFVCHDVSVYWTQFHEAVPFAVVAELLSLRSTCSFFNAALLRALRLSLCFDDSRRFQRFMSAVTDSVDTPVRIGRTCDRLILRDIDLSNLPVMGGPRPKIDMKAAFTELSRIIRLEVRWTPVDHDVIKRLNPLISLKELVLLPGHCIDDLARDSNVPHAYEDATAWSNAIAQLKSLVRFEILTTDFLHTLPANVWYKERTDLEVELISSWMSKSDSVTCIILAYHHRWPEVVKAESYWRLGRFERMGGRKWKCTQQRQYRADWFNTSSHETKTYMALPKISRCFL